MTAAEIDNQVVDCYTPVEGGWRIRLTRDDKTERLTPNSDIGVVPPDGMNPRLHRRPLYPPADRSMVWTDEEIEKIERYGFRPLIVAYNEPRFLFDYHSAGGLLGHLYIGITTTGASKWFHQWDEIEVSYVDGRMDYTLQDAAFPGLTVSLAAIPLSESAGLIVKIQLDGSIDGAKLVWAYGGASAFFTNWAMDAEEFTFSPDQCSKDVILCSDNSFSLVRAFDDSDVVMKDVIAAAKHLPEWTATIRGGSSWNGSFGFGSPEAFPLTPGELVEATDCISGESERRNSVAVRETDLEGASTEGYVVVGMGGNIEEAIRKPEQAWQASLDRISSIASRIVLQTPDPHLDSAATMMAFATDGLWGDTAIMHGGWSWRYAYLGWRGWYGPNCYGWTDRIRDSMNSHIRMGLMQDGPDKGGIASLLELDIAVYYNMNEVFLDQVRHYFDYTNDISLMREIFPTLVGVVEWEMRRLQPDDEYLYENCLNTWISDAHWYIGGQCTQASAYMLRANSLLADLARRLGHDPVEFEARAEKIRSAMQRKLWMARPGVFAECLDTCGNRQLHPEPELPTIYHSAEFGAADPLQVYQMLHWADTHLEAVETPGGGKQYWSSNWFPNIGRSYTHSTYEMAYAEELNFALTNYLAGRADEAYAILRSCHCGIFNGPTPGGLSCHSHVNGRQRSNDEFADAISMWGRTVYEGLFGIALKRPDETVELCPQFPADWNEASIKSPHFSYNWRRGDNRISIRWESPVHTSVRLRLSLQAEDIDQVTANGEPVEYNAEPGVGLTWLQLEIPSAMSGEIEVIHQPILADVPEAVRAMQGDELRLRVRDAGTDTWLDPQNILIDARVEDGELRGTVSGEPVPALLFISGGTESCPMWVPIRLVVEPTTPSPTAKVWCPPDTPDKDLRPWSVVDLGAIYNASVPEVMQHVAAAVTPPAEPYSQVGFIYYRYHLTPEFVGPTPSDAAWREKVGPDGIAWTTDGIPFRTAKEGNNIGVVTLAAEFPAMLEFRVNLEGSMLYLMIGGTTFAAQSHVVNLRLTLKYAGGAKDIYDLVNPFDIGDCWNQYRFHDTAANGFENIGGRFGPSGSAEVDDLTKPIKVDTEAHLLPFELRQGTTLETVSLEAIANDVIFGIMGASVRK